MDKKYKEEEPMKKHCKLLSLILALLFVTGSLSGIALAEDPIEVVWWCSVAGSSADSLDLLIQEYNESQSKYNLVRVFQGSNNDIMTKLAVTNADSLPALFSGPVEQTGYFEKTSYTAIAQDFIDADPEGFDTSVETIYPQQLGGFSNGEGRLVGFPFGNSYAGLWYNYDLCVEAGIDPEKDLTNLEDIVEACRKVMATGRVEKAIGFQHHGTHLLNYMGVEGVDVFNNENGFAEYPTEILYNTTAKESLTALLQSYQTIYAEGMAVELGTANADLAALMGTGKICFALLTISQYNKIMNVAAENNLDLDIGIAAMPAASRNGRMTGVPAAGTGIFIAACSNEEAQQGAYDFIKFLYQPENQAIWATVTGYLPVGAAASRTETYQEYMANVFPRAQAALDAQASSDSDSNCANSPIATEVINANALMMERVATDASYDIGAAIDEAQETLQEALDLWHLAND